MTQATTLMKTLKRALKNHGLTYAAVGRGIKLTESSVKRLFSKNTISLNRLNQICNLIGLEISDLVDMMNNENQNLQELSELQELKITNDLSLLLVMVCTLNNWSLKDITTKYQITENACLKKLLELDRLRIIKLLPGNRIKVIVSPNFGWRKNGPIQNFFQQKIGQEYFKTKFTDSEECLLVLNGMLSPKSNTEFQRKLRVLAKEFNELSLADAKLPLDQRKGVTTVLAIRDWHFGIFKSLRQEP